MLKLLVLAALVMVASPMEVMAADDVFGTVTTKGAKMFESVKKVVFVMGGFGLVGLAVGAIFGAVKWKWFASLGFGLAVLALASAVVEYFTGTKVEGVTDNLNG